MLRIEQAQASDLGTVLRKPRGHSLIRLGAHRLAENVGVKDDHGQSNSTGGVTSRAGMSSSMPPSARISAIASSHRRPALAPWDATAS